MTDKLPSHATGDQRGVTTYPHLLMRVGAANGLHIAKLNDGYWDGVALCGTRGGSRPTAIVEFLGDRRHPVCARCRKVASADETLLAQRQATQQRRD